MLLDTLRDSPGTGSATMAATMHRIKVVNDVSDLVPILRAVDFARETEARYSDSARTGSPWTTSSGSSVRTA